MAIAINGASIIMNFKRGLVLKKVDEPYEQIIADEIQVCSRVRTKLEVKSEFALVILTLNFACIVYIIWTVFNLLF